MPVACSRMQALRTSFAPMALEAAAGTTRDTILGGRITLVQPRRGHRAGHDAILLAAAIGAKGGQHAVDLGAGVGAAGLALAARVARLKLTFVEIDATLAELCGENIAHNGFADRARTVVLDVVADARAYRAAGLAPGSADHVLMNPPFNDPSRRRASPNWARRLAHSLAPEALSAWVRSAGRLLCARGVLSLIWRADELDRVLAAIRDGFGDIAVLPIHARASAAAIRVIVRAIKTSRAPLRVLPALVLSDETGRPTPQTDAILRGGAALPIADL